MTDPAAPPITYGLPPTVETNLNRPVMRKYWKDRARQHTDDSYVGVRLSKWPEDLRVYEHLLWLAQPDVLIELGVQNGGSTLWFRDRLHAMARYTGKPPAKVVAVEIDDALARETIERVDPSWEGITLLQGDVTDPDLPARVREHVPAGAVCMVVEDTAHVYDTTLKALEGFWDFVPPGGFFVVEDGSCDVEELRLPRWPRGVLPALHDWLETEAGQQFEVRRDLELYGMTCHPEGFLQRRQ